MSSSPPIPFQRDIIAGDGLTLTGSVMETSFDPDIVTDVAAKKASAYVLLSNTFTTGTSQPTSLPDSLFIYNVAGGAVNGNGTLGVVSGSFASSGAETGTGSGQAGLGSAVSATQPYNITDFPGQRNITVQLRTVDGDDVLVSDLLSSITGADASTKVYCYLSYRSDLGADLKWRLWYYYRRSSDGYQTPFTPDLTIANASLYAPIVYELLSLPVGAGLGGPIVDGDAAAVLGPKSVGTAELDDLAVTTAKIAVGAVTAAKLADTLVTPGSYTSTNLTVDQQGRITAAASGSAGPALPLSTANGGFGQAVNTGLTNDYAAIVAGGAITIGAITSASLTTALTTSPPITLAAGNAITMSAGAGNVALGSSTGAFTFPTGNITWAGASGRSLSIILNSGPRLTLSGTNATLYGSSTTQIGTSLSTTTISGGNGITIQSGVSSNILIYSGFGLELRSSYNGGIVINSGYTMGGSDIVLQIAGVTFLQLSSSSPTVYVSAGRTLALESGSGSFSGSSATGTWSMPSGAGTIISARVNYTQNAITGSTNNGFIYTGGAHTTLTASTEKPDWNWNGSRTVQFATGALTNQRQYLFQPATYGFVGASTLTNAATVAITGAPVAGTNATITNAYALWVQAGRAQFDGTVGLATGQTLVVGSNTLIGAVTDKLNAGMLAIASQATGDILYANAATTFARLGIGSTGQVLTVSGGVPSWATLSVVPAVSISVTASSGSISSFASWYPSSPTFFTTTGESSGWISYVPSGSTWKIRMSVDGAVPGGETLTMQARFCATINGTWSDLGSAITRVNADGTAVVESAVLTPGSAGYISFKATYTSGSALASITHMEVERVS